MENIKMSEYIIIFLLFVNFCIWISIVFMKIDTFNSGRKCGLEEARRMFNDASYRLSEYREKEGEFFITMSFKKDFRK